MSKLTRKTFTAAQAKSHFADSLRAAEEGGVVVITRYGKPVAALVHFSELEDLERLRNQSSQDGLGGLLHKWEDSDEFTLCLDVIERSSSPTFDFNLGCANLYGKIRSSLQRRGQPIGDVDTQIAATALRHNLTLVTANARHFRRFPGLRLKEFIPKGN